MKKLLFVTLALFCLAARASDVPNELYSIEGKNFETKAAAIRYVINSGKRLTVLHTRCEILTNKLTFKACPKNKKNTWESEQFAGLKVSQ